MVRTPRLAQRDRPRLTFRRCIASPDPSPLRWQMASVSTLRRLRARSSSSTAARLTRSPRGLRRARTGYSHQPPAYCTYQRRRAACPKAPCTACTGYASQPRACTVRTLAADGPPACLHPRWHALSAARSTRSPRARTEGRCIPPLRPLYIPRSVNKITRSAYCEGNIPYSGRSPS